MVGGPGHWHAVARTVHSSPTEVPVASVGARVERETKARAASHPRLKSYVEKIQKDNLRFLVAGVAWSILVSVIPIVLGLLAVSTLIFHTASQRRDIVHHLSHAVQGVFKPHYLQHLMNLTFQHTIITALIAAASVLGASDQIGSALTSAFSAMFEVRPRSFWKEKLLHLGMFLVFAVLMLGIIGLTSIRSAMAQSVPSQAVPIVFSFPVTTAITLICSFLLFAVIYLVYPNTKTRLKLQNVWRGALLSAMLFQVLTFIWPLYISTFSRYGGVLFPILVLTLWIYFFSFILMLGGEVVAIGVIDDANEEGEQPGPPPDGSAPQHETLRREGAGTH